MKLSLKSDLSVPALVVTEEVGSKEIDILKIGIGKYCQKIEQFLILDVSMAIMNEVAKSRIPEVELVAFDLKKLLLVAGPDKKVASCLSVKDALNKVWSTEFLMRQAVRLSQMKAKALKERLNELFQKQKYYEENDITIISMREENNNLKRITTEMEQQIEDLIAARKDPVKFDHLTLFEKKMVDLFENEEIL